jgi:hypothetical protein
MYVCLMKRQRSTCVTLCCCQPSNDSAVGGVYGVVALCYGMSWRGLVVSND